jgi:hypothetical protein
MSDKQGSVKSSEYSGTKKSVKDATEIPVPSSKDMALLNRSTDAIKDKRDKNKIAREKANRK